jgi:hypothetical protein
VRLTLTDFHFEYCKCKSRFLPRIFDLSVDLEHVFDLEAVEVVSGGVRVLDVLLDDLELVRLLVDDVDVALQLGEVSVDRVEAGIVGARFQEAVSDLDLQEVVQHVDLRLDVIGIVEN